MTTFFFITVDIKLYLQKRIKSEDVKALLAAVLSTESFDIQEEILRLILHILKTSDHVSVLGHLLMSEGTPLLALLRSRSNSVSQTVTNVSIPLYIASPTVFNVSYTKHLYIQFHSSWPQY